MNGEYPFNKVQDVYALGGEDGVTPALASWPWLQEHWSALNAICGVPAEVAERQATVLVAQYQAEGRHYHNLTHIESCLRALEAFGNYGDRPGYNWLRLAWALWFHDCVDDRFDKEGVVKSAAEAETYLRTYARESALLNHMGYPDSGYNLKEGLLISVRGLILATDYRHAGMPPLSPNEYALARLDAIDVDLMRDIDLSTLGGEESAYFQYADNIRREYSHVDDEIYRIGRSNVLKHFLSLPQIYQTQWFYKQFEIAARQNLSAEMASLGI